MDTRTIEAEIIATKFCSEPCAMQQAYSESEVTRLFTEQAQAELLFTVLALAGGQESC